MCRVHPSSCLITLIPGPMNTAATIAGVSGRMPNSRYSSTSSSISFTKSSIHNITAPGPYNTNSSQPFKQHSPAAPTTQPCRSNNTTSPNLETATLWQFLQLTVSTTSPYHDTNHPHLYPSTAFTIPQYQMTNRIVLSWGCVRDMSLFQNIIVPKCHCLYHIIILQCHCLYHTIILQYHHSSIIILQYHHSSIIILQIFVLFHHNAGFPTVPSVPRNIVPKKSFQRVSFHKTSFQKTSFHSNTALTNMVYW